METTKTQGVEGQPRTEESDVTQSAKIITMLQNELAELKNSAKHPWASKGRFRFAMSVLEYVIQQAQAIHDESHRKPTG